jgi:hypothetical protein
MFAFGFEFNGVSRSKCQGRSGGNFKKRQGEVLNEGPCHGGRDANNMWMNMTTCIRKVASKDGIMPY